MLSPANAELARRETALPGLAILLDPEAFLTRLRAAFPGLEIEDARPRYVRHKRATNFLVLYEVVVCGRTVPVYAKSYGPDADVKLGKAQLMTYTPGALGAGCAVMEDVAVVVHVFPNDVGLPALANLGDAASRQELLRRTLKAHPELWRATPQALNYKPERRYVARLETENGPRATLKLYSQAGFAAANIASRAKLGSEGPLRLPAVLGRSAGARAIAFEWLPGVALRNMIADPGLDLTVLDRLGAALAALHRRKSTRLARRSREAEIGQLRQQSDAIGFLCPGLAATAGRIAEQIAARLADLRVRSRAIHGDFSDKQVLVLETGVAILDLDEAVAGDPASDLGLFIAHLERDALAGRLRSGQVERLSGTFLDGYRRIMGKRLPKHIGLYAAFGLMQLAVEPFRTLSPDWPAEIEAMLARAEALLAPSRSAAIAGSPLDS